MNDWQSRSLMSGIFSLQPVEFIVDVSLKKVPLNIEFSSLFYYIIE